jgi:hypothetical protein
VTFVGVALEIIEDDIFNRPIQRAISHKICGNFHPPHQAQEFAPVIQFRLTAASLRETRF